MHCSGAQSCRYSLCSRRRCLGPGPYSSARYGRLQCLASVGLLFRVYKACVPPTAAYGCEIWGFQQFPQRFSALRQELVTSHLQMLKEITGVRGSTSTDILLAELGLKSLQHCMFGSCVLPNSGITWLAGRWHHIQSHCTGFNQVAVVLQWDPHGTIGLGP